MISYDYSEMLTKNGAKIVSQNVKLRGLFTTLGRVPHTLSHNTAKFTIPGPVQVDLQLDLETGEMKTQCDVSISEDLLLILQTDHHDASKLSRQIRDELGSVQAPLHVAARRVMYLIRCCYQLAKDIREELLSARGYEWSTDGNEWKRLPQSLTATVDLEGGRSLDDKGVRYLQQLLDEEFEPFFAYQHFLRARSESLPHYKWIDATIAAELAIKECLSQIEPKVQKFLEEVPSPPLHKMYGELLKHYGGQRSPMVREIQKGSEKRNKLVHTPAERVDAQSAVVYTFDVEEALYHLLTVLYPNNEAIEYFFLPRGRVG